MVKSISTPINDSAINESISSSLHLSISKPKTYRISTWVLTALCLVLAVVAFAANEYCTNALNSLRQDRSVQTNSGAKHLFEGTAMLPAETTHRTVGSASVPTNSNSADSNSAAFPEARSPSAAAVPAVVGASMFDTFWHNFSKNLFKPLLLFFYLGFAITLLRVPFEFPQALYQGLTIYLLLAIGWHGGEELAQLSGHSLNQAMQFMAVGFITNFLIGAIAYLSLRKIIPKLRRVDAATVAAYYGSDSAGTFVTCLGVLQMGAIAFAAYMPVMLAVMEMPGCLLGLYLVSRLRSSGMDCDGNMPNEPDYHDDSEATTPGPAATFLIDEKVESETALSTEELHPTTSVDVQTNTGSIKKLTVPLQSKHEFLNPHLIREIFLNPGIFLLLGGILIGYVSRLQGSTVTAPDDQLFVGLFQGMLCLFLLEMGMTAARRIRDLKAAGKRFVVFALIAPNVFALIGISVASLFSHAIGQPLDLGTYVLFAVLCAAASYIAVPAIQRLAIPEASPTLPLAASLGVTFTYNVTIGIPLYLTISEAVLRTFPV